jgi:uncharacterized membrane protein YvbJ
MVYCRHCGDQIPVDSVFCPSCGKNLLPDEPSMEGESSLAQTAENSSSTHRHRTPKFPVIPWQRYRNAVRGVIHLGARKKVRIPWTVSQILFASSGAFAVVGFFLSLFGLSQGLAWILFGLVLGLGAFYTKGPPTRGTPPTLGG